MRPGVCQPPDNGAASVTPFVVNTRTDGNSRQMLSLASRLLVVRQRSWKSISWRSRYRWFSSWCWLRGLALSIGRCSAADCVPGVVAAPSLTHDNCCHSKSTGKPSDRQRMFKAESCWIFVRTDRQAAEQRGWPPAVSQCVKQQTSFLRSDFIHSHLALRSILICGFQSRESVSLRKSTALCCLVIVMSSQSHFFYCSPERTMRASKQLLKSYLRVKQQSQKHLNCCTHHLKAFNICNLSGPREQGMFFVLQLLAHHRL